MTILRTLILSGFALGMISGCDDSVGVIDYQLQGGFVGHNCSIHIDANGKMTRTMSGQTETTQLDAATRSDIEARIDEADFPSLEPAYSCSCADDFVHIITVDVDGAQYTVTTDQTSEHPDRLQSLIEKLEDLSGCGL